MAAAKKSSPEPKPADAAPKSEPKAAKAKAAKPEVAAPAPAAAQAVENGKPAAKGGAKKGAAKAAPAEAPAAKKEPIKDPEGGLTDAGREHFKETEGANLQPGVKGPAKTPEDMKRKGSFLRRHYGKEQLPPLTGEDGKPTRFALQAKAWGERIPKTVEDVQELAAKGTRLLERYEKAKTKEKAAKKAEADKAREAAKAEKAAAKQAAKDAK